MTKPAAASSHWPIRGLRRIVLGLVCLAMALPIPVGVAAASAHVVATAPAPLDWSVSSATSATAPSTQATTRPAVAILIDGLCSALSPGASVPASFGQPKGIAASLESAGWPASSILAFSYTGGSVDAGGSWAPNPYTCDDTRSNGIAHDAATLDGMISEWLARHPGTNVELVGYSLGGLVALAYLARLADLDGWVLPSDGRLGAIVTLDSPLGGLPFVDQLCAISPGTCGGPPLAGTTSLGDMSTVWSTSSAYPAGATRSVAKLFGATGTNQALAIEAARNHGTATLSIGNMRDWAYDPTEMAFGPLSFRDTQWLIDQPPSSIGGAGVWARVIDSGATTCPTDAGADAALLCNHPLTLTDPAVEQAILDVFGDLAPSLSATCPPGTGNCLAAPPRRAVTIASAIAAGVVSSGGTFRTSLLTVPTGSRATVRFTLSPAIAGAHVQIWARTLTGSYRRLTSRVADSRGVVRYCTAPVTAWTAIQARFAGDGADLPAVSAARVATIR